MIIPPFAGVALVEYRDRIELTPVYWVREFVGLGRFKANKIGFQPGEAMYPFFDAIMGSNEIWVVACWLGDWVHSLAPWQVISHMTFSWEASIDSAQRCYEKFMRTEMRGVSYFYALEQNPSRDGYHVHALWCDCLGKSRRDVWQTWFNRYGRARIEPVNNRDDVADYCAKYVSKERSWWNVKLLSHRHPAFANFKLAGD